MKELRGGGRRRGDGKNYASAERAAKCAENRDALRKKNKKYKSQKHNAFISIQIHMQEEAQSLQLRPSGFKRYGRREYPP